MVSTCPLISKSSSPFTNPSVIVTKAQITIGIIVTFRFHSFLQFTNKVEVLFPLFTFFQFYVVVSWDSKVHNSASFVFFVIIIRSSRLAVIRRLVCMLKSHWSFWVSFSRTDTRLWIYHLFVWSNLNSYTIPSGSICPAQLYLVLYSICANLLHSIYMWLFRLYHHITCIYCFIASYLFMSLYGLFLWRCFVMLLEKIPFLS